MDVHGISEAFVRDHQHHASTDMAGDSADNVHTAHMLQAIQHARALVQEAVSQRDSREVPDGMTEERERAVEVEEEVRRVASGGGLLVEGTPVVLQAMAVGCELQDRPVLSAEDWILPKKKLNHARAGVEGGWNWRWILALVERCRAHGDRVESVAQRDADSFYLWLGSNGARAFQARLQASRWRMALEDTAGGGAKAGNAAGGSISFGYLRYNTSQLHTHRLQSGQYGMHTMTSRKASNQARRDAESGKQQGPPVSPPPRPRHFGWFRRAPTSVLFDGERDEIRVGAAICVYDDGRFLEQVVDGVLDDVEHVLILLSATPWHGQRRDISATAAAAWRAVQRANDRGRVGAVSIISGAWGTEGEQREYANKMLEQLPVLLSSSTGADDSAATGGGGGRARTGKLTHALVLDADEFYDPVELRRMFILASRNPEAPWFRAAMATYFRTLRTIIAPPEELRILWLLKLGAVHIDERAGGREFYPLDGKTIHDSSGRCHHISYVRTTSELVHKKFASFQHAKEVEEAQAEEGGIGAWVKNVWRRWRAEPNITHLHPIEPPAYAATALMPLMDMPPVLRQMHTCYCLRHQPHRQRQHGNSAAGIGDAAREFDVLANNFGCGGGSSARASSSDSPSWLWRDHFDHEDDEEVRSMLCDAKWPRREAPTAPTAPEAMTSTSLLPPITGVLPEALLLNSVSSEQVCVDEATTNDGDDDGDEVGLDTASAPADTISDTELNSRAEVVYQDEDILERDITDVNDFHVNGSFVHGCQTRFLVVVIGEGVYDSSTKGTFDDIAALVASGLQELGFDADVAFCRDMRFCRVVSTRQLIILGAHNLAHYFDEKGELAVVSRQWPPEGSVLYNLEFIPGSAGADDSAGGYTAANEGGGGGRAEDAPILVGGSMVNTNVLRLYSQKKFVVWDYSQRNLELLKRVRRSVGVAHDAPQVQLVPLGYHEVLAGHARTYGRNGKKAAEKAEGKVQEGKRSTYSKRYPHMWGREGGGLNGVANGTDSAQRVVDMEEEEDIDVLFYGHLNDYRAALLERLRTRYGLRVLHANRDRGLFGPRLDRLIRAAKIVLNLRFFSSESEWKMTRLMRLVAQKRFIISERSGTEAELARFEGGIVFAEASQIGELCLHYLKEENKAARRQVANKGFEIFSSLREAQVLREPLQQLWRERRCNSPH
jgi:hypothetical protein